jgi:hypothetical protein
MVKKLALFSLLGAAVALHAATITHGTATDISGDSDVVTTGTLVGAFTLGGSSVFSPTVNGVDFTGLDISSGSASSGDFSLSLAASILGSVSNTSGGSTAPFSGLSTSYQDLLSWASHGSLTITMSGLTVGDSYLFEWWTDNSADPASEAVDGDDGRYTLKTAPHSTGTAGELGQFVTDSFTADGATQTIKLSAPPHGGSAEINAFQLRDASSSGSAATPEPSSAVLMAFGVFGLIAGFRRRRYAR